MNNHPINVLINEIQNNFETKYKIVKGIESNKQNLLMLSAINACLRKLTEEEIDVLIYKVQADLRTLQRNSNFPDCIIWGDTYITECNNILRSNINYSIKFRNCYAPEVLRGEPNKRPIYDYVKDSVRVFSLGRMKLGVLKSFSEESYRIENNLYNSNTGLITTYIDNTLEGLVEQITKDLQL